MSETSRISRRLARCNVMETIVHCAPISRASVAKQTGLSKQTVSEIARQLEDEGWIRETGRTSGHVGRTALTYEVVPDRAVIAAVDLGGTKVRAAIADLSCQVLGDVSEPTDKRGGHHVVNQIARLCRLAAEREGVDFGKVRLAVVGVPGAPESETGRVLMAPNIPGWDVLDVTAALSDALGVEVLVENDVNLAVRGEHWMGAGAEVDDLVLIALGTGIGGGIMVGGELVRGAGNAAGELGFLPFGADPFEPASLHMGALERRLGSEGIVAFYRNLSGRVLDVKGIFDAAETGEDAALQTLDEAARLLARAVAGIAAITNPACIVLGGSIGVRGEMVARVRELMPLCFPRPVAVEASVLGPKAALIGAAAVGLGSLHASLWGEGVEGGIALPSAAAMRERGVAA
ncbi:MAG: ROK family transcriptional regulator [Mesorhizobium amorphae]|nr:MAG: ROK family transcriptional regulator [Mesorhizobium amorphae]